MCPYRQHDSKTINDLDTPNYNMQFTTKKNKSHFGHFVDESIH